MHGIGREFAKYYEAYADFLEGQGNARAASALLMRFTRGMKVPRCIRKTALFIMKE